MEEFEQYYPPKPTLIRRERKGHISITFLSMVIFALTFSLIIDDYQFILFLLGVLLIHELGHFLTMKYFGYSDLKMLFIPFMGAMVKGEKKHYSQKESALMLMAGPLPGIIFGYFILNYGVDNSMLWAIQIGVLFMLLNVMNLVPIDPLDGGQLMRVLFFGNQEFFQFIFAFISSLGMIILGLWFNSWLIIAFGFILGFRVKSMHKLLQIRKDMKSEDIDYESTYEKLTDRTFAKIKAIVIDYTPILRKIEEESDSDKFDQIVANQVEGVLIRPTKRDASLNFKVLMLLVWLGAIFLSVYTFLSLDFNSIVHAFQNR